MAFNQLAQSDFEKATGKAFWRRLLSWFTGQVNELLDFDAVRARLPMQGQRDLGMQQVEIGQIVGSAGRFRDFDRLFLPLQTRTKDRWVSIDRAHYEQVNLPPVDLYKMGEVYFVKDGNHRVSVARERGQTYIDAHVVEISIPIPITADMDVTEVELAAAQGRFLDETGLHRLRPGSRVEASQPGLYETLREHIADHRYYLGEKLGRQASPEEAAISWYENVYLPTVQVLCDQGTLKQFPRAREADLYLWVVTYQWYLRQAYAEDAFPDEREIPMEPGGERREEAARQLASEDELPAPQRLARLLQKATWVEDLLLEQERAGFMNKTRLAETRPEARIESRVPIVYARLLEHIAVHRWYLGEQHKQEVPMSEAATSWYDQVYAPVVEIIREQEILAQFPERSEADLYLWVIERRERFKDAG